MATVERGKKVIVKLARYKSAPAYSFQYRYQYFPGRALRKVADSAFVYLLPACAGSSLRVFKVSSIEEELGLKRPDDYYATGFIYKLGDTICAARAGIVYQSIDTVKEGETSNQAFKSDRNRIAIQNKDGTLNRYSMVAPIQLLVSEGDYVIPGQHLAIFNKKSEKYHLFFATYYLDELKLLADNNNNSGNKTSSSNYSYLATRFYLGENDSSRQIKMNQYYTVHHPLGVITAEMPEKEKKKFGLQLK